MELDVVNEVPNSLKRLVRMVMRGFYTIEHVILIDMLIRNPCMKEDDLVDLLQFEKKQLRSVIAQLKNDRFVKVRLRMETGPDGKATRQNYYYINYKVFVNVVKYKLDHMRRKIETEERDSTSRASFKCTACEKTFTDLEADHLCDFMTGEFKCSYCSAPVEEDQSALPKTDSRLLLAKFNEQIKPLYILLREVEDIKLAPELLEPEPTDVSQIKRDADHGKKSNQMRPPGDGSWSGDLTRNKDFLLGNKQDITISIGSTAAAAESIQIQERKERPIWMVESTVHDNEPFPTVGGKVEDVFDPNVASGFAEPQNIMEALLAHEKKGGNQPIIPGQEEHATSESEEDKPMKSEAAVEEMESEDEDDEKMVTIGSLRIPLHDVTAEHIAQMTPAEKEVYIKLGQEMYADMYE